MGKLKLFLSLILVFTILANTALAGNDKTKNSKDNPKDDVVLVEFE